MKSSRYSEKRKRGIVPSHYPAPQQMRGVHPHITSEEAAHYNAETLRKREQELKAVWGGRKSMPIKPKVHLNEQ